MVATRHSLPANASSTPEPEESTTPASSEKKRKLQNALKKLVVDGKDTLIGGAKEQKDSQNVNTYHFRGAVYEAIEGTAPEWIEQQPERYKKRTSSSPQATLKDVKRSKEKAKQDLRPRKSPEGTVTSKKRARESEVTDVDIEDDEASAKRPRRNADKYDISYARPRNIMDFTPSGRKSRKRQRRSNSAEDEIDRMRTSRLHDYTVVGGREDLSCMQHAKIWAERRGYHVKPLPRMPLERSKSMDSIVTSDLMKLARLNTQIEKGHEELMEVNKALTAHPELRAKLIAITFGARNDRNFATHPTSTRATGKQTVHPANAPSSSASLGQLNSRSSIPSNLSILNDQSQNILQNNLHEPTPSTSLSGGPSPSPSASIEITTERHDSGASLTPPPATTIPMPVTSHFPSFAKDGSTLRWSLPGKLTEPGRAEEAITFGRLKGESKAARRRRVKREIALVRRWQVEAAESEEANELNGAHEEDTTAGAEAETKEHQNTSKAAAAQGAIEGLNLDTLTLSKEPIFIYPIQDRTFNLSQNEDTPQVAETPSPTTAAAPESGDSDGGSGSGGSAGRRSSRMEEKKSKVCKLWLKGSCWRGRRCTFGHEG